MSKPKYRWWQFARKMVRDYPGLRAALQEVQAQTVTANITGMPRGGGNGRTVENLALRQLTKDDQADLDAVALAKAITRRQADGALHLRLISLMYWVGRPLAMKDAALQLHIAESTAKRWHGDFIRLVGKCHGFQVDTPEPK